MPRMNKSDVHSQQASNATALEPKSDERLVNGSYVQSWPEVYASYMLWMSAGSVFLAFALFGHVLSIVAVLGSRRLRSLPLSVHIVANALSGLLVACTGLLQGVIYYGTDMEVEIRNSPYASQAGCQAHAYLTYFSLQLHAWIQATVSAERLVAVRAPLHYQRLCTRARAVALVVLLTAVLLFVDSMVPAIHSHNVEGYCDAHGQEWLHQKVWGYMDMLLYSLVPAAIILPSNIFTVGALRDHKRQICSSTAGAVRSRPITIMLLTVNTIFLITTVPVSVIVLVDWPPDRESRHYARFCLTWTIFSLLQYGGCSASFLVYCLTSSTFRRGLAVFVGRHSTESQTSSIPRRSNKLAPPNNLQLQDSSTQDSGICNEHLVAAGATNLVERKNPLATKV